MESPGEEGKIEAGQETPGVEAFRSRSKEHPWANLGTARGTGREPQGIGELLLVGCVPGRENRSDRQKKKTRCGCAWSRGLFQTQNQLQLKTC